MNSEFAHRTTKKIVGIIIGVLVFIPIAIFVVGEAVYHLWNWLMPMLFHLPMITFWQAVGIMILSWLLFGGLRGAGRYGSGHRGRWQLRDKDRWEQMTPEERDKFREWVRTRCGQVAADAPPKP
ncbi:MAG: hypothetical protein WBE20_05140 [Candidatus Acidiferrales bacterium]